MNLVPLFVRNFLSSVALVGLGWLYFQNPAAVELGSFVVFLKEPITAMIVMAATLALSVVEWLS